MAQDYRSVHSAYMESSIFNNDAQDVIGNLLQYIGSLEVRIAALEAAQKTPQDMFAEFFAQPQFASMFTAQEATTPDESDAPDPVFETDLCAICGKNITDERAKWSNAHQAWVCVECTYVRDEAQS